MLFFIRCLHGFSPLPHLFILLFFPSFLLLFSVLLYNWIGTTCFEVVRPPTIVAESLPFFVLSIIFFPFLLAVRLPRGFSLVILLYIPRELLELSHEQSHLLMKVFMTFVFTSL
ncbi:hypothetical protein Dimus_038787 [Dionaea muscipula]